MSMVPALDLRPDPPANDANALPFNIDAEQAVLGAVLYDNAAMSRCEALEARQFYEPLNGRLWAAMVEMIAAGRLADHITLASKFETDPAFEEIDGFRYLMDLIDRAPPGANAPDYAREVIDYALRRDLIRIGDTVRAEALAGEMAPKEQLERAEGALFALAEQGGEGNGIISFAAALDQAIANAEAAYSRNGAMSGLSTGLIDLDQKLGGLHPSDLIILAGRPSMGKTALATNIAFHAARHYATELLPDNTARTVAGGRVLFFSLEMSADQLAQRILAEVTGISGDRVRKGKIEATEYGRMRDANLEIREAPLRIDATGGLSIARLSARARREKRRNGLDLIVVDYLQLITTANPRANRVEQISEVTQALKALAKDLGVPVIALSQLSRDVEKRDDKRPQLSDLRESGSIEQDADAVLFVYREAYYLERAEPKAGTSEHVQWCDDLSQCQGVAEVIVGKQRHGPIGAVKLAFHADTTKFGNLAREGRIDFGAARNPAGGE